MGVHDVGEATKQARSIGGRDASPRGCHSRGEVDGSIGLIEIVHDH
jgi:hypothetical protein